MPKHTRQTVRDLIQARWESDMPDKIIDALRPLDGKLLTTRTMEKLPGGKDVWHLRRQYGMTHIENEAYRRSSGDARDGVCLLVAHTESAVTLDVANIIERNPAYFSARVVRNHARMEAMNTRETLDACAAAMNRVERAIAELEAAESALGELTDYGKPLHQDCFDIERACGMRDVDARPYKSREYKDRKTA